MYYLKYAVSAKIMETCKEKEKYDIHQEKRREKRYRIAKRTLKKRKLGNSDFAVSNLTTKSE